MGLLPIAGSQTKTNKLGEYSGKPCMPLRGFVIIGSTLISVGISLYYYFCFKDSIFR
jgi:hypothetical protein